jgi:ribosomal protein L29
MAKTIKTEKTKEKKGSKGSKLSDLTVQAKALRDEVATLRLDNNQKKLKNTTSLTLKRKELARLLTAMREVELTHEENI